MLNFPDFVEVGALLVGVALVYWRPKCFFYLNLVLGAAVGTAVFGQRQLAGEVTSVRGTPLVDGRITMRAAVFELGAGEHDVTVHPTVPVPASHNDGEVLVRVHSAGLNPSNFKLHKAKVPFLRWLWVSTMPVVGYDFAGVVVSAGAHDDCRGFAPGARVFGFADGSMAEFAVTPCGRAALSPATLNDTEAGSLPVVALTSLAALDRGGAGPGSRVLVVGASGGCGIFGVTLAKARGARVTGICSTRNVEFVKGLGADEVVDYRSEAAMAALRARPAGSSFDVVYDTVTSFAPEDPDYEPVVGPLLASPGGRYEAINGAPSDWLRGLADQALDGLTGGRTRGLLQRPGFDLFILRATRADLEALAALFDGGHLPHGAPLDSLFPLTADGMNAAFTRMKSRRAVGKIVITVDGNDGAPSAAGGGAGAAAAAAGADNAGKREL